MAGPWEKYAAPQGVTPTGPWEKYAPATTGGATGTPVEQLDKGGRAAFGQSFLDNIPIVGPAVTGLADRVGAGMASLITGDTYANELAKGRARAKATEEAHPIASIGGGLTGGVMSAIPMVAAAPAFFGAGPGALTLGKVGAGAGSGFVLGAGDAAVRSGGDLTATGVGGLAGGAMGAIAPVAGAALSRAGHAIADSVAQRGALQQAGVSRPAADVITRVAEADTALSGRGLANIRIGGPDAMLADAGPGLQNVLDTAIQRGGPKAAGAKSAIEGRAAGAGKNMDAALNKAFGPAKGVETATTEIRVGSAPARKSAYDAAYSAPIDYTARGGMEIENLVRNHVPASAINQANALIRSDPTAGPSRQILAKIADDGAVTYERLPDVRQLDYITRALNDVAKAENGKGKLGGQTDLGRAYENLAGSIRRRLKSAVPEYAHALETAASPIQAREALDFGSEMLRPNVPRDVVMERIRGMTGPEKAHAKQGIRAQLDEAFANIKRTITDPNIDARQAMDAVKQFSSKAAMQKVGLLLNDAELRSFKSSLTQATRALELRSSIAGNSKTAARTMTNKSIEDATALNMGERFMAGEPIRGVQSGAQFLTQTRPSDLTRRQDSVYGELANILTGPRGRDAEAVLRNIRDAYNKKAAANSIAGKVPYGALTSGGALTAIPLINQGAN